MRFLQANIANISLSAVLSVLNMALSIIEARVLGPEVLGNYQVYVSTQTLIFTICALGLGNAGIYYINSGITTSKIFVSTILRSEIVLSIVVFILLYSVIFFNEDYFGHISSYTLTVFCIGSSASLLTQAITPVLLTRYEVFKYQGVSFVSVVLTISVIGLLYAFNNTLDIQWMLVLSGFCKILSAIALLWFIRKDIDFKIRFLFSRLLQYLKYGIQYSMTNIAYLFIINIPIYALSWLCDEGFKSVGLYTRAVAICTIAIFVNKQIGPLLFAKLSSCNDSQKIENTRLMATFFLIFNTVMIIGIEVLAYPIVNLLYGQEYIDAVPLVRILAISVIFTGTNELVNNVFSSIGKPRYIFFNLLISMATLIPLIYISISYLGITGAPLAVSVINGLTTILLIRTLKKHIDISYSDFFMPTRSRFIYCFKSIASRLKPES